MESSPPFKPFSPSSLLHPALFHSHHHPPAHHHHHYHLHASPHCPFHNLMLHPITHLPTCPFSTSHGPTTQNSQQTVPLPFQEDSNSQVFESKETAMDAQTMQDENEQFGEEEDEEPVFVLTDEWREFFAKSEAKRRLAKKQSKKKGKS